MDAPVRRGPGRWMVWLLAAAVLAVAGWLWGPWLGRAAHRLWQWLADPEAVKIFLADLGWAAPLIFMGLQVLQVLLAPFPGEATGFLGGYLFGPLAGFIYSTLALTLGSGLNFFVARRLGRRPIQRLVPAPTLRRFDRIIRRQGALAVFYLFLFPGFPKDYLCLFLGLTAMPGKLFIILAAVGRIPGTLMLSFQGALVFQRQYTPLAILTAAGLLVGVAAYLCREALYDWFERLDGRAPDGER